MRGIKINLAAFPGNSQTQILTSPITFFSLLLSLSLSLSKTSLDIVDFARRNRSPPLTGGSFLVNTRDISPRISLFLRAGEGRRAPLLLEMSTYA